MKKDNRQQNNNKNKGYYQIICDRYLNAAKESNSMGDKVLSEYNLQHAEHYIRFINEKFPEEQVCVSKQNIQHIHNNKKYRENNNNVCNIHVTKPLEQGKDEDVVKVSTSVSAEECLEIPINNDTDNGPRPKIQKRYKKKVKKVEGVDTQKIT